ncbi:MobF family relaxase [Kineosporia sp. NBRC 101731]|uniref:MobF family relaxase n=1 Tax=Kineosporia sp. NBRC 101731 TaxID=3032199 RepID=UPI0025533096|nr:MobF family relaxase [Kineosporia sp. NBRC 101731]
MTIAKLTAGDGYLYLMRDIATAHVDARAKPGQDVSAYYAAEGNPPGIWIGRGLHLLGLAPDEGQPARIVQAEQMQALFGMGLHPDADARIRAYQRERITAGMAPDELKKVSAEALRSVTLGRPFAAYTPLEPFEERVQERLAAVIEEIGRPPTPAEDQRIRVEEARRHRGSVAGYDLVFAPVKSAALLWALDERAWVRDAVIAAHHEAKDATLAMLEQHAAFTRTGTGGVAQIETKGLIGVSFDHYDSRDSDPNPHTHMAISNKVQGIDGIWRTLDGRALFRLTVAASEHYNTAFQIALTARTGVRFEAREADRGKQPVYEIAGIDPALIKDFSRRRSALAARYEELTIAYRSEHGHDPSASVAHKLSRRANLDTRRAKRAPRSLPEMRATWREQALTRHGRDAVTQLMAVVQGPENRASANVKPISVQALAAQVVANVAEKRSIWTVWNLRAEAERLVKVTASRNQPITGINLTSIAPGIAWEVDDARPVQSAALSVAGLKEHRAAVTAVVERAIAPGHSISIEAPVLLAEPENLKRSDGSSVFVQHGAGRYTNQAILDAEHRLVHAATSPAAETNSVPSSAWMSATLDGFEAVHGRALDAGQRAMVTAFATDERLLSVGIGAAGTGKTTAMVAYLHTLQAQQRRLIPLATSAASAAVLANDLNVPAENVHKFLHEHLSGRHSHALETGRTQNLPPDLRALAVRSGDVILVDEAGMAGTFTLDRITAIAAHHGASVRLLGDYRQLSAVESGGALRLIAAEAGAVELSTLHRFHDPDEAAATLQIRTGDTTALRFYEEHERIRGGSVEAMTDAAYRGWWADVQAGKVSVMVAATNADVTTLAARARADRVKARQVEAEGIELHDGNLAGTGDWIVTRQNQRRLSTHRGKDFVRNGDAWHVLKRHDDGSLEVRLLEHSGQIRLPAAYVRENVELLYASTVHRTQGSTVETTHALISAGMLREHLYVALTRAAAASFLYVATHHLLSVDEDHRTDATGHDPNARAALEVLHSVLNTEGTEVSATQAIRDAQAESESLATLMPRYVHAVERANAAEYRRYLNQIVGKKAASPLLNDPAWPDIAHALNHAATAGWNPKEILKAVTDDSIWKDIVTEPSPSGRPGEAPSASSSSASATMFTQMTLNLGPPSRAQILAERISILTDHHHAPAPLAQPTPEDVARYSRLIAGVIDAGTVLDPAAALKRPADPSPFAPIRRTEAVASRTVYSGLLSPALGSRLAERATRETAWPAVQAALRRLHEAGHDPAYVLRQVSNRRDITSARSISSVLAWRLGEYGHSHPVPKQVTSPVSNSATSKAQRDRTAGEEWSRLTWLLKAQENAGTDVTRILPRDCLGATADLGDLIAHVRRYATTNTQLTPAEAGLPPWAPAVSVPGPYIQAASSQLRRRVGQLAQHVIAMQPEWLRLLGGAPADPHQLALWREQIAVVAGYRDQHEITDQDPYRPLGPYIEPGDPNHRGYWQASHALHAAQQLGRTHNDGSERSRRKTMNSPSTSVAAPLQAAKPADHERLQQQIAVDLFRVLPEAERLAVSADINVKLGRSWLGPISDFVSNLDVSDQDALVQHPAYVEQLHLILQERGHLTSSIRGSKASSAGADQQSRRTTARRSSQTRYSRSNQAAARAPRQDATPSAAPLRRPQDPQRYQGPRPRF